MENGGGIDGSRRNSTPGEKSSNDLFSVHDFDIKIDLDVPNAGKIPPLFVPSFLLGNLFRT